jgi:hypothetical protein
VQLYERFRPGQAPPKELGPNRDWNVDLVPKFMMANGKLVRVLLHTGVVKYLEFKAVDGSFVLSKGKVGLLLQSAACSRDVDRYIGNGWAFISMVPFSSKPYQQDILIPCNTDPQGPCL